MIARVTRDHLTHLCSGNYEGYHWNILLKKSKWLHLVSTKNMKFEI